MKTKDTEVLRR